MKYKPNANSQLKITVYHFIQFVIIFIKLALQISKITKNIFIVVYIINFSSTRNSFRMWIAILLKIYLFISFERPIIKKIGNFKIYLQKAIRVINIPTPGIIINTIFIIAKQKLYIK